MAANVRRNLPLIFERPCEPIFYKRGSIQNESVFAVSNKYLLQNQQEKSTKIINNYKTSSQGSTQIGLRDDDAILNIDIRSALDVGRREIFSTFLTKHQRCADFLIKLFMNTPEDQLLEICSYCHDRVNAQLFNYSLSVACYNRENLRNLPLPSLSQVFPQKYFDSQALQDARETASLFPDQNDRDIVTVPFQNTGTDAVQENLLFYFREDVGVNLHHWHWHLVYPFSGPRAIVDKDRRGELFYYMHQQIMARYNTERLCNRMNLVKPLQLKLNYPIKEEYFPKLDSTVASRSWPGRPKNLQLSDIKRPEDDTDIEIEQLVRSKDRILTAIQEGSVRTAQGETVSLLNEQGIDILGNLVESSILSVNRGFYGNLHNEGHNVISYIHDPNGSNMELAAVMGDSATAMRDPVFYRWHGMINNMFLAHKNSLPPYTSDELSFPGCKIQRIDIISKSRETQSQENNLVTTFWSNDVVNLTKGLDFAARGDINARITHLNYREFVYRIQTHSTNKRRMRATCRIFIAPRTTLRRAAMPFRFQKELMIELDKFLVDIPPGNHHFTRLSTESAVTIPYKSTFRDISDTGTTDAEDDATAFCGCGWPQHMLMPRGSADGFPMDLFCMLTDYEKDRVDGGQQADPTDCRTGVSYCGLRNQKYPDIRPMGFPFDRPAPQIQMLSSFVEQYGNMSSTVVRIKFDDQVRN